MESRQVFSVKFFDKTGKEAALKTEKGASLLEAANLAGFQIDAPCAGNGTCGKCRVRIAKGAVGTDAAGDIAQKQHLSSAEIEGGFRLACQAVITEDVEVEIPQSSLAVKNLVKITNLTAGRDKEMFDALRSRLETEGFTYDASVTLEKITLTPPAIEDAQADLERCKAALEEKMGAEVNFSVFFLRKVSAVLRENDFYAQVVLKKENSGSFLAIDVFPPEKTVPLYALAIDIGTTTCALCLVDTKNGAIISAANAGNAQVRYGADVINRMIYAQKKGGLSKLNGAIVNETLVPLIDAVCADAEIERTQIYRAGIAGNTTMLHIFMNVPPDNIRLEPYVPSFFYASALTAQDIPLPLNPSASLFLAPNIGSYVGGDITAGVFASGVLSREEFSLFIDLGTNGELVFGNKDFSFACACSAGPAFEGGDISCGMRASDGAIEALTINDASLEPAFTVVGGGKPAGLCGSGLIDTIGELFRTGLIDARGKFTDKARVVEDSVGDKGWVVAQNADNAPIMLTEADIDNFIKAKGALFSAIRTMLAVTDFSIEVIDKVYIAGGIGSGINIEKAVSIGMLPALPLDKFQYLGNTSLQGVWAAAVSRGAEDAICAAAGGITYIELSSHPGYMDEFTAACFLPHTNAALFA